MVQYQTIDLKALQLILGRLEEQLHDLEQLVCWLAPYQPEILKLVGRLQATREEAARVFLEQLKSQPSDSN
jgi:hypothetical protein